MCLCGYYPVSEQILLERGERSFLTGFGLQIKVIGAIKKFMSIILKTKDGPLYYEVTGAGPPIVFSSGWAMSCECWRPVVRLLERKYRCLIFDPRGVGRSQPASVHARFDIEDHAEDLHSILTHADFFDSVLIGHELGGLVTAALASLHPQDMRALVLVSPRSGISEKEVKKLALFTPASLALRELAAFPFIRTVIGWRFRRAPQPERDRLFNDFADLSPRAAYETALSMADPATFARLEELIEQSDSPMLVVAGEKDRVGSVLARQIFSRMQAGKLATVTGSGFLPMLEYPEQFAKLIDSFAGGAYRGISQALARRLL